MKIVVSSEGPGLKSAVSPIFGRCPVYVFIDTNTMAVEPIPNPAQNAPGGAGIQAAQFVVSKGVKAVLTGNVGPNANDVLSASGIDVYMVKGGTVEKTVADFMAGKLPKVSGPTATAHAGTKPAAATFANAQQSETVALAQEIADLRQRLADVLTRIDKLEKES